MTETVAVSVVVSPESRWMTSTWMPRSASLISCAARSTPAISGGPRKARAPDWGRMVPIVRVRSSRGPSDSAGSSAAGAAQPLRMSALAPSSERPPSVAEKDRERPAEAVVNTPMLLLA